MQPPLTIATVSSSVGVTAVLAVEYGDTSLCHENSVLIRVFLKRVLTLTPNILLNTLIKQPRQSRFDYSFTSQLNE